MGILRNALRRARAGSLEHDWRQRLVPTAAPIDGDSAYVHGELLAIEDVRYMPVAAWEPGKAAHWREALDRWYVASRNVLLAVYAYEFNQLLAMTQTAVELLSSDLDRRRQRDTAKPPLIAYLAEYTGTSDACHDELQQKALQRHIADRDELGALYRAGLAAGGEDWRWVEWYTARIENWADQASAERERQMLADPFRRAYYEQLPDYWMG
jgi:hypothetical protein